MSVAEEMVKVVNGITVRDRLARLRELTSEEMHSMLVFLDGYTPDGVDDALASVHRRRERAAAAAEAGEL